MRDAGRPAFTRWKLGESELHLHGRVAELHSVRRKHWQFIFI